MVKSHGDREVTDEQMIGRVRYARTAAGAVVTVPSARNDAWVFAAVFYGVPWLVAVVAGSVWYLGWGIPSNPVMRVLLWLVVMLLTFAMHTAALLAIWSAVYSRVGREEIVIDGDHITVVRHAGRIPLRVHIGRSMAEQVHLLSPLDGIVARPRIEVKAGRAAIRFGASLADEEAEACAEALRELFGCAGGPQASRVDPAVRGALPSHLRHPATGGVLYDQGYDGDE